MKNPGNRNGRLASYLDGEDVSPANARDFLAAACALREARPWASLAPPLTHQLILDLGPDRPRLVVRIDDTLFTIYFSEADHHARASEPDGVVTPRLSLGWERAAHALPRLRAEVEAHGWRTCDGFIPVLVMIGPEPVAAPVPSPFLYLARVVCLTIPALVDFVEDLAAGATIVVAVGHLEVAVNAPASSSIAWR